MKYLVTTAVLGLSASGALAQTVVTQWDQFAQTGISAAGPAMDKLIETCEPALGGAEVLRTVAPSIGIRDSYRLAVAAGKTPDLAYTWPAASVLAGYARIGALAELDPYYEQYGWDQINDFYRGRNSFEGHLYGVPMEQDLMGVYFNRALFEEHGIEVPTTYEEFEAAANAFKEAGIIPISFGNRDRWPATNTFSLILGLTAGKDMEEQVFFGDEPWTNDAFLEAAQVFQDWADQGWFPPGFNGIGYDEANAYFLAGRAAMTITGTWVIQDMIRGSDNIDLDVFMLPPIGEGVAAGTMWGEGSQWQLSADADQATQDAAAAYLDCLISDESRQVWVQEASTVPIGTSPEELTEWGANPVVQTFFEQGLSTPDANFYDLHTTLPESVTQVLYPELQRLAGGETAPEEFLAAMQASWDSAIENGERWIP
ncbi:ABC transporter substrate-binding protein [Pelagovum pacificum]|uniref:Extracellular solute-binding protein n=1 Tax=Pelagovum pacificum TaxID=2588711 RepID=A0A5C5GAM1_9RHOB|nr:extracellular solute-binding protein [Pelagovum pacificum]QQA41469.1 extracellular solute-binding protein [Pelagovum pacificum]TNY31728.1 extracellular solute-binding protein [Pelagovum pacificum]